MVVDYNGKQMKQIADLLALLNKWVDQIPLEDNGIYGVTPGPIKLYYGSDRKQEEAIGVVELGDFNEFVFTPND